MTALDADPDVLATAGWECGYAYPDRRGDPSDPHPAAGWYPVQVPGTAAGALVQAGEELAMMRDYDRYEWWFKCSFTAEPGPHDLRLGGLATLADVWLNGRHLLHSENMFLHHELDGLELEQDNFLVFRFSPLADAMGVAVPGPGGGRPGCTRRTCAGCAPPCWDAFLAGRTALRPSDRGVRSPWFRQPESTSVVRRSTPR